MPCKQTARYVIVETTYDAPEDDYIDEHGAILEICEIKAYGCGKTNGICIKGCKPGQYGGTCDETCSHGCAGRTCDQQKGTCSAGCKQNWTGRLCDVCDATHYGPACSMECNINCLNNTCNDVTGSCKDGCLFGKFGDFCNKTYDEHCGSCCHQDTDKYKKLKESNLETLFILYGMIAALCVSLIVNGWMIKWNLRRDQYKGQDVNQNTMNKNVPLQDSISPQDMYDTVGDDTKYEDLGQLSGSPHYDQLELIKPS
nr:scavenger receptor class F member 2-like [Crassostrea gigas]